MSIRPLTARQLQRWNLWLWKSHGLRELPGHTVFRCDVDFPIYLTPWTRFDGFALRQDHDSGQVLMSFDLAPGVRTIAHLWSGVDIRHTSFRNYPAFARMKNHLITAANEGRIWWGTETLNAPPHITSICYWFPENPVTMPDTTHT